MSSPYEEHVKSIKAYVDAYETCEEYRDLDKLRKAIKEYYKIVAKMGARKK